MQDKKCVLLSDLHTHTVYSHGSGTPEENVIAAIECGLKRIAISEHGPRLMACGVSLKKLRRLRNEIDMLNTRYCRDIEVLMGLEANVTGYGHCDVPSDTSMFDMIAVGFHRTAAFCDMKGLWMFLQGIGLGKDPKGNAESVARILERFPIAFVTHPGRFIAMDIDILSKAAAALNVAVEINTSCTHISEAEIRIAANNGSRFVINSDAHTPKRVGDLFKGIAIMQELGLMGRVINDIL